MFEQLGRTFFSFKQNPFALPTFNMLLLFFLFCGVFSPLWKGCDDLSFQSCVLLVSKTPQSCQAGKCSSGEDLKFQTV